MHACMHLLEAAAYVCTYMPVCMHDCTHETYEEAAAEVWRERGGVEPGQPKGHTAFERKVKVIRHLLREAVSVDGRRQELVALCLEALLGLSKRVTGRFRAIVLHGPVDRNGGTGRGCRVENQRGCVGKDDPVGREPGNDIWVGRGEDDPLEAARAARQPRAVPPDQSRYLHVCVCVCVCVHISMYTQTQTHTHTTAQTHRHKHTIHTHTHTPVTYRRRR